MAVLKEDQKLFIVQRLACFDTPSVVVDAVNEEFGIKIDRMHVQKYDPTKAAGKDLSQKFKSIFFETRKAFLKDISTIPIANQAFRLRSLQLMHDRAVSRKNDPFAKEVLEQAAKEVSGYYSKVKESGGENINPFLSWLQQIGSSSLPVVHEVEGTIVGDDDDDDITTVAKSTPWKV